METEGGKDGQVVVETEDRMWWRLRVVETNDRRWWRLRVVKTDRRWWRLTVVKTDRRGWRLRTGDGGDLSVVKTDRKWWRLEHGKDSQEVVDTKSGISEFNDADDVLKKFEVGNLVIVANVLNLKVVEIEGKDGQEVMETDGGKDGHVVVVVDIVDSQEEDDQGKY